MKKRIFLLSTLAALSFFASCSDDDNNNNTQTPQTVELYTSSNTSGKISVTDLSVANGETVSLGNIDAENMDSDGIYYDYMADQIIQASRSRNKLNLYGGIQSALDNGTSLTNIGNGVMDVDFTNAREIAVTGNTIFVAQDQSDANGMTNKIVVFTKSGNTFTKTKTYIIDFKLWGIHADGNNLYAVVDNTGDIARFDNILSMPEGAIFPTKRVTINGLTRTHGITYSADADIMVLTDVGSAASDSDGGIIVIEDWNQVYANTESGTGVNEGLQNRIYGSNTMLGNPVDVAYDSVTQKIYVAERANGNGRVLTFDRPQSSTQNVAPIHSRLEPGVSAVYLSRR